MIAVICCIAKNENNYINDWINWHINLGFNHIFIYDNNDLNYEPIESRIELLDKVTIYKVPGREKDNIQKYYYNKFYQEHKNEFDWCAFIDCDEFVELTKWNNINEFLNDKKFNDYQVIRLNMRLYGDDDKVTRDITIPVYKDIKIWLKDHSYNTGGKSIIRGHIDDLLIDSSHYPLISGNVPNQINPDGIKGKWMRNGLPDSSSAHLNHYRTKTISEFIDQKFYRGDAVNTKWKCDLKYFWAQNKKTKDKLDYIQSKGL